MESSHHFEELNPSTSRARATRVGHPCGLRRQAVIMLTISLMVACSSQDAAVSTTSSSTWAQYSSGKVPPHMLKSGSWSWIAGEGQAMAFGDTQVKNVRYGHPSFGWAYKDTYNNNLGTQCTSAWFDGFDPAPGQSKHCEVFAEDSRITPTAQNLPASLTAEMASSSHNWNWIASDGQDLSFASAEPRSLRFGNSRAWVYLTSFNSNQGVTCGVTWFGWDPAPGESKTCEVYGSSEGITASTPQAPSTVAATPPSSPPPAPVTPPPTYTPPVNGSTVNVFYTGHSLLNNPVADNVELLASSTGRRSNWNQQIVLGSPIRFRTRGWWNEDPAFNGYNLGTNRNGRESMDVIQELRSGATIGGERYQALVITERHDLVPTLIWEDTVRNTRHFHERLIEGNPQASSYLYHSWLGVRDMGNPWPWIEYERAAARTWQCVASRINTSLAREGRGDRVHYLPAGLALADLAQQALSGWVDGISTGNAYSTMRQLFTDDVHLTPLGSYYMSLVTYAMLHRNSPVGAWAPAEVTAAQARSLQSHAWNAMNAYAVQAPSESPASCAAYMRDDFCVRNSNYLGIPQATSTCLSTFASNGNNNPFAYDPSTDASYWAPPPAR